MRAVVVGPPTHTDEPGNPEKHTVSAMVKGFNTNHPYLIPSRKTTKLMLPWVIGFQEAKSYLRSSGKPMKLAMMLADISADIHPIK